MTKKDYILIAKAIRETYEGATKVWPESGGKLVSHNWTGIDGINVLKNNIAKALNNASRLEGGRFDINKFNEFIEKDLVI